MNDTKGCFDQIQHTFAVLVLTYYGVVWLVATTLFEVLQKAQHKITTGYGVSAPVYGNEESLLSLVLAKVMGWDPKFYHYQDV